MAPKRIIRIGFLGFGTVGQGVWKHLDNNRTALELRLGVKLELARVVVNDLNKPRAVKVPADRLTTDPAAVVDDPSIDVICELIGGTGLARELTARALRAGKIVVTANKALLCDHGAELFALARRHHAHYFFEASVAGGIPIIKTLREGLVANRFRLIHGILNGTSNYILTRMEREGLDFESILKDARQLGYVEADEALDLDGVDAAHKAVILAFLAHGKWVKTRQMLIEGIRGITTDDINYARELGYRIKLLAVIRRNFKTNRLFVGVHPALIPLDNMLARVDDVYNGISLTGDVVGTTLLIGRGAGQDATASAVISDIADAVIMITGAPPPVISEEDVEVYQRMAEGCQLAAPRDIEGCYYLRLQVRDKPGVLAEIAGVLSDHAVSIARMVQHEHPGERTATLILTTHRTNEQAVKDTTATLHKRRSVLTRPFILRLFDQAAMERDN